MAPSTQLRQFYDHRPERFAEFRKRYRAELRTVEADAAHEDAVVDAAERAAEDDGEQSAEHLADGRA